MHIDIVTLSLIIDSFPLSPQLLQQWMYKQDLMNRYCGFDVCPYYRCLSVGTGHVLGDQQQVHFDVCFILHTFF